MNTQNKVPSDEIEIVGEHPDVHTILLLEKAFISKKPPDLDVPKPKPPTYAFEEKRESKSM